VLFDEVRAGGRIPLIIGRGLTPRRAKRWACRSPRCSACRTSPVDTKKGFSLAQKMVGRACGLPEGRAFARARTANPR
jgi:aconitate hydratase 2/2-methylisocitrate dehydratase